MKPLIALHGKQKAGKTTVGDWLTFYYDIRRDSFAKPLKEAAAILGVYRGEASKDKVRRFLQEMNVPCHNFNPALFPELLFERNTNYDVTGLLVDDLRKPIEYEYLNLRGFTRIKLEVTRELQIERGADAGTLDDATETMLDGFHNSCWDIVLPADITIEEACHQITEYINALQREEHAVTRTD